jgi:hypothetical protein
LEAGLAAFFIEAVDRLLTFLFGGLFFLTERFLYGTVAFLIVKFAEIIGFAFAQAGTLPGGGSLFHVGCVCCFTTVVKGKDTIKRAENLSGSKKPRTIEGQEDHRDDAHLKERKN